MMALPPLGGHAGVSGSVAGVKRAAAVRVSGLHRMHLDKHRRRLAQAQVIEGMQDEHVAGPRLFHRRPDEVAAEFDRDGAQQHTE